MSQPDAPAPADPFEQPNPPPPSQEAGQWRRYVLFALLLAMFVALWYDRKIARPHVESAFDRIERLNEQVNSQKGRQQLVSQDVQSALKLQPDRVFTEGGYHVEVYSWRAGLPIITRDYFALYSGTPPYKFLKHFKFELPQEELTGNSAITTELGAPVPTDKMLGPPSGSKG